jgi:pimeloyl-ACP methyl ester carboxylesterase
MEWKIATKENVSVLKTGIVPVVYYMPRFASQLTLLAHGYPWPDGTITGARLLRYVRTIVGRWVSFAEENDSLLIAPAFGGGELAGYRGLFGVRLDADVFVNQLVDRALDLLPSHPRRFDLWGHSAGGQFAARYLVSHPRRLRCVVLSAPGTYPFPDRSVPWPHGMAPARRDELSGDRCGQIYAREPMGWVIASSEPRVTVLIGTDDTARQRPEPGQKGNTRVARAEAWVLAMRELSESHRRTSRIHLQLLPGLGHDEFQMIKPGSLALRTCGRESPT